MAFDSANFDPGASPKGGAPNIARYFTADASTVVEAANYFNSIIDSLLQGGAKATARGLIFCDMSDEATMYGFTATRATGVVLLAPATLHIYIP